MMRWTADHLHDGTAEDPPRMIPLISGGSVMLQTKQDQQVGAAALARVPDQPRPRSGPA